MHRTFASVCWLLVVCLPVWSAAPQPSPQTDLPPRIQSPTDKAQFRRFVLDNGMRVLLVSDPKFNKSGAALVVHAGQIDDPRDTEGMAHFLEHMLFLGTEKYPDVAEYGNFIRANGGYNNAYTSSDHTNYQFEVRHEAFAGALDRFAQFFIAPSFNADFVQREVSAVNNEAMRHLQNDSRRQSGVLRELYDPQSGESKFSTGNKETLALAKPAAVRAFYESLYSADRMALALAGKASLDDLEKLARSQFPAVPKRTAKELVREPKFLPVKDALRLVTIEPVKEVRRLYLEFVVPATRPDFAAKSDQLVTQLIAYPGTGGLLQLLKKEGLVNDLNADVWERTQNYGSLIVDIELTPQGQAQHQRVLKLVFSYLEHLRSAAYPADYFADRARIAQLAETFSDRGEGAALATKLANQALFYPLDVAERATDVWGKPNEASYRRLLDALRPNRMMASLMAKGLPVERKERIYGTGYAFTEQVGTAFDELARPVKVDGFALPRANVFMPTSTELLAERPVALIDEPALQLFYAQDTEFQRPATSLLFRFVPVRASAQADTVAMLRLFDLSLQDVLTAALGEAGLAGVDFRSEFSVEGYRFSASGFGDSPARFATFFAEQLRTFKIAPQRFEALKEAALRQINSYNQTEAYALARNRRDAFSREFLFLPPEQLAGTQSASLAQVQSFAQEYFSKGRLEALVHGNLSPEEALKVTRKVAQSVAVEPVPSASLLHRRHLTLAANENVLDAGPIAGANSALLMDYMLRDDSAATRAAASVLGAYFNQPFYTELRTRQQLGYIVGSSASGSLRDRYFTFIVQSSDYGPAELRRRAEAFIATLPTSMAKISDEEWATLIAGARANLEQKPKSIAEKAETLFTLAYDYDAEWGRRQAALAALNILTKAQAVEMLTEVLSSQSARRRTVMLASTKHEQGKESAASIGDRTVWKAHRQFQ